VKTFYKIASIFIALTFVYVLTYKSIITFNYFANQSEIIELFCINKDKPTLECNGKCHLAIQLTKVDTNENNFPFSPNGLIYNLEINLLLNKSNLILEPKLTNIKKLNNIIHRFLLSEGYTSNTSPPPKVN
jgi:hypothetical protein